MFFITPSAGVLFTRQKSPPRLGGFLVVTTKQTNLNKNYAGTKVVVLLLIGRKEKK
jgi:hypothetical protein